MIIKVITGSNFHNALAYGAGELNEKEKKKAEKCSLIWVNNIVSEDYEGIADEMNAVVRDSPSRVKNPVLHVIVSPEKGEKFIFNTVYTMLTDEFAIDKQNHQVAVYLHRNTENDHFHIYFNRVNMDSGKAVKLNHSRIRCVSLSRKIEKELGIHQLTTPEVYKEKKENKIEIKPTAGRIKLKKGTIGEITEEILSVITKERPTTVEGLIKELAKIKIGFETVTDKNGINGCRFIHKKHGVYSGSTFGLKWKIIEGKLNENEQIVKAQPLLSAPRSEPTISPPPKIEAPYQPVALVPVSNKDDEHTEEPIQAEPEPEPEPEPTIILPPKVEVLYQPAQDNREVTSLPVSSKDDERTEEPISVAQINDRLLKFYAFVGVGGPRNQYHNTHIFNFVDRARGAADDGLKMVAKSLAKDFVDPVQAADMFEKQILADYEKQGKKSTVIPYNFVREYRQNPDKQQFINREKNADSAAWQIIEQQSNTFPPPKKEIFEQLQKESLYHKSGLLLGLKNGRGLKP